MKNRTLLSIVSALQHHTQEKVMNATTRWNLKPLSVLALIVAIGLVSAALEAKGKGKPPKDDPPPPPSPGFLTVHAHVVSGRAGLGVGDGVGTGQFQAGDVDRHAGEWRACRC